MDRLFRIDFYPQEWITQTGKMTLDQRGIFIQICSLIYSNRGPIENNPSWIGRASNCSSRLARKLINELVSSDYIQITSNGFVTQKRCERELNLKRTHLEISSKGGKSRGKFEASSGIESSSNLARTSDECIASISRTRHENDSECNKNNDLTSTDTLKSVSSPTATATATANNPPTPQGGRKSFREKKWKPKLGEEYKNALL